MPSQSDDSQVNAFFLTTAQHRVWLENIEIILEKILSNTTSDRKPSYRDKSVAVAAISYLMVVHQGLRLEDLVKLSFNNAIPFPLAPINETVEKTSHRSVMEVELRVASLAKEVLVRYGQGDRSPLLLNTKKELMGKTTFSPLMQDLFRRMGAPPINIVDLRKSYQLAVWQLLDQNLISEENAMKLCGFSDRSTLQRVLPRRYHTKELGRENFPVYSPYLLRSHPKTGNSKPTSAPSPRLP